MTGWVTAAVLALGGTAVAAAAATPVGPPGQAVARAAAIADAAPIAAPTPIAARAPVAATVAAGAPVAGAPVAGTASAAVPLAAAPTAATAARRPPLPGEPVRRFEPPPHDYGPGHRGVDLAATPGTVVVAPADGVVTFAGPVAGRGVVVIEHAGATLTSLEPVTGLVAVGTAVAVGRPVATVQASPGHAGCATAAGCLHWGVRVEGRYVDPWWWLGRGGPVRLLPLVGP